jgi:FtsP/CotA-like multicopper oxidase with cupredoxin domain
MGLPETLPALAEAQRPITDSETAGRKKTLTFTVMPGTAQGGAPGNPPKYLIGVDGQPGTQFDPNVVNECMEVDTAEEWTLENYSTPGHPFHIHLNPFYITEYVDGDPKNSDNVRFNNPVGLWQDVIIVPAAYTDPTTKQVTPGKVVFRHRFPDITGKFVLHCHILGHEDRGFMHIVEIHAKGEACSAVACGH